MEPQTCKDCGATKGEPLDHNYIYGFCNYCNKKSPDFIKVSDISVEYNNPIYSENCYIEVESYEIKNIENYYYGNSKLVIYFNVFGITQKDWLNFNFQIEFYDENGVLIKSKRNGGSGFKDNSETYFTEAIPSNCRRIAIVEHN